MAHDAAATPKRPAAGGGGAGWLGCRVGRVDATLWTNALLLLVAEASRGLFVSSLFTYILALSGGASGDAQRLNSLSVSGYSVGRLLAAQLWGLAADRLSFRAVYTAALGTACLGHALYVAAEAGHGAAGGGVYVVLAARALVGFGSGVLGVARAVVSVATPPEARTGWFSALSAAKFVGYAIMPVFCIAMGDPPPDATHRVHDGPHWDSFTMPAYSLLAANVAVLLPLWLLFDPALNGRSAAPEGARPPGGAGAGAALELAPLRAGGGGMSHWQQQQQQQQQQQEGATTVMEPLLPAASRGDGGGSDEPPATTAGAGAGAPTGPGGRRGVNLLGDPLLWSGVLLFTLLNGVSKGVLTLMEAIATPLFERLEGKLDSADNTQDVAVWFALLGSAGFLVYLFMALPRTRVRWLPGDLSLLVGSSVATAVGALVLAHPWPGDHSMATLTSGAVLVWSVGAPVADVVATSCFSLVVAGKAQGRYMGLLTMAGSVGRIVLPLVTVASSAQAALLLSTALTAAGVPAVLAYKAFKARREAAAAAVAAEAASDESAAAPVAAVAGGQRILLGDATPHV